MSTNNSTAERYIAAVDLGTSKIALAVARTDGNSTQVIFYRTTESSGIRHSEVINPKMASEALERLIREAEEELDIKIKRVAVGLPRCGIRQEEATGSLTRTNPDESIIIEEIEDIKEKAMEAIVENIGEKEKLYGLIADTFSCGDYIQQDENEVVGMTGDTLAGHFKVFIGKKQPETNLNNMFTKLDIGIAREYFTPLATGMSVLTNDERSGGVALVDLGDGVTSVSIFKKGVLVHYASIPYGGSSVTFDIQTECCISGKLAENIKKAYGGCLPDKLQTLEDKILQIETDDFSDYRQIPVKHISEIITAREKEIIDAVLYFIQESKMGMYLRYGIVITGGGAEMLNIANMISEISGFKVRAAGPHVRFAAGGCPDIISKKASTVTGLIMLAQQENLNCCTENDTPAELPEKHEADVVNIPGRRDELEETTATQTDVEQKNTEETVAETVGLKNQTKGLPAEDASTGTKDAEPAHKGEKKKNGFGLFQIIMNKINEDLNYDEL